MSACRRGCYSPFPAEIPRWRCAVECWSRGSSIRSWCPGQVRVFVSWFPWIRQVSVWAGPGINHVENIPDFQDSLAVVSGPNAEDILSISHAQDDSAYFIAGIPKLVSDNRKQQIFPITISDAFLEAHNPFSSILVLVILPYWPDALLEEVVV